MRIKFLDEDFSICKLADSAGVDHSDACPLFFAKTPDELSLVCPTASAPANALKRDDDWRAFRIEGQLDFGLTGILAGIARVLADNGVAIFACSTFDTDYVLVKKHKAGAARDALVGAGYKIG